MALPLIEQYIDENALQKALAKLLRSDWIGARLGSALIASKFASVKAEHVTVQSCDQAVRDSRLEIATSCNRETDLVVSIDFTVDGRKQTALLLCEVKIIAPFGIGQVEDYAARVLLLRSRADLVLSALIGPQKYLLKPEAGRFDCWLTLESIQSMASKHTSFAPESSRLDFELEMVGRAIEVSAAGSQPLISLDRQAQFAVYDAFVSEYAPHLRLNSSSAGERSLDRFFETPLRIGKIKHRLRDGLVVVEFLGKGFPPDPVRSAALRDGLSVELAGSSSHIGQRRVPGLEMDQTFDAQLDTLQSAADEVSWLYRWLETNREAFVDWAD